MLKSFNFCDNPLCLYKFNFCDNPYVHSIYISYLILHSLICRVFQVVTNIGRLVQVDFASFLDLQVLEDNRVGGRVENVEKDNRFNRDPLENIFHKNTNSAQ